MNFKNLSLRHKLIVAVLPIVIISVAALSIISYRTASKNILSIQETNMEKLVNITLDELGMWLGDKKDVAKLLADNPAFKAACRGERLDEAQQLLRDYHQQWPQYENLFLADPEGQLFLMAQGDPSAINLSNIPIYTKNAEKARQGELHIGEVAKSPVSGRPVSLITMPIMDGYDVIGMVGTPVELNAFSDTYISKIVIGKTGYIYMTDSRGVALAHPDKKNILVTNFADYDFGKEMLQKKTGEVEYVWEGRDKVTEFAEFKETGWIVAGTEFKDVFLAPLRSLQVTGWILGILSLALIAGMLWLITGAVARVMNGVADTLQDIAEGEGDLTKRVAIGQRDEIGTLAHWFDLFLDKLNDIIKQVKMNTEEVSTAASEITATAAEMAAGAEEQSSQTTEVATSVQQMSAAILENSQNASDTTKIAAKATEKARQGAEAMNNTKQDMVNIVDSATRTGEIVQSLAGRADQIDSIIQVIVDIADQTNLLALNAAIEAARAGEQGRGFAVVADEVRKLAERTTKATSEISQTIQAIQTDTKNAATSMEEAGNVVEKGQKSIEETGLILDDIISTVQEAMDMIQQIAAASEEQSLSAETISKNVEAISTVAHQSAGGAEELAATAEELNQQTEQLRQLVSQFKLT